MLRGGGGGNSAGQGRVIAGDLVLVGIAPGQDARQAGRAETAGDVTAAKDQALARQAVEPGRLDLAVAHEAIVAVAHVVGDQQHDVGRRCRGLNRRREAQTHEPIERTVNTADIILVPSTRSCFAPSPT